MPLWTVVSGVQGPVAGAGAGAGVSSEGAAVVGAGVNGSDARRPPLRRKLNIGKAVLSLVARLHGTMAHMCVRSLCCLR